MITCLWGLYVGIQDFPQISEARFFIVSLIFLLLYLHGYYMSICIYHPDLFPFIQQHITTSYSGIVNNKKSKTAIIQIVASIVHSSTRHLN